VTDTDTRWPPLPTAPVRSHSAHAVAAAPVGFDKPVGFDNEAWRRSAACHSVDPDLFFPVGSAGESVDETEKAKAVCGGCPVRAACLAFALVTRQEFGVWGGLDEHERRRLHRQGRRSPAGTSTTDGRLTDGRPTDGRPTDDWAHRDA